MELLTGTVISAISIYIAIKVIEISFKLAGRVKRFLSIRHQWNEFNRSGKRY